MVVDRSSPRYPCPRPEPNGGQGFTGDAPTLRHDCEDPVRSLMVLGCGLVTAAVNDGVTGFVPWCDLSARPGWRSWSDQELDHQALAAPTRRPRSTPPPAGVLGELTTDAAAEGYAELCRPKRAPRRSGARSDPLDAIRAAREALARPRFGTPRSRGERQALSALLATRPARAGRRRSDRGRDRVVRLVPLGRIHCEAAFAMLAGVAPIPANSPGDQAQPAQPLRRPTTQPSTAHHRAVQDPLPRIHPRLPRPPRHRGKTSHEIKGCLSRYIARDLHRLLESGPMP